MLNSEKSKRYSRKVYPVQYFKAVYAEQILPPKGRFYYALGNKVGNITHRLHVSSHQCGADNNEPGIVKLLII